jgi:uncharacterized RDD family membrane protein YckC
MNYAGFWIRVLASIIDALISLLVVVPAIAIFSIVWAAAYNEVVATAIGFILNAIVGWLYYAFFESGKWQATPGKRLVGLRVTDLEGNRIGFGRASGRYFSKILSGLILYIGFFMAGWTEKKQGLHDKLVDTLVLRGKAGDQSHEYSSFSSGNDATAQTVYVPHNTRSRWILSGFDANGHVVRLSFNDDDLKLDRDGLIVGRDGSHCDLQMDDPSVSRRHAKFFNEMGAVWMEDLGSANGTLVNGRKVRSGVATELPTQGNITFGAVELSIAKY